MEYARYFSQLQDLIARGHTARQNDVYQVEASSYTSDSRFRQELKLFEQLPLFYDKAFPAEVNFRRFDDYNHPLLVTREGTDHYHAFPNICRHRAATLMKENEGHCRVFTCPYHAWTYDLKGEIIAIPNKESFEDCPLHIREHNPTIEKALDALWVCLRPEERLVPSISAYLDELHEELMPAIQHFSIPYGRDVHDYPFNWKFAIDAVLESYHVMTLHHSSFKNVLHGNLGLHERCGLHSRNLYPFRNLRGRTEANHFLELIQCTSFVYHLFPNTVFSIQPMFAAFFTVIPLTPTSCRVRTLYLVPSEIENQELLDRGIALTQRGVNEDHDLLAGVARNLESACRTRLHFGQQEASLGFFHRNLHRLIQRI